MFPIKKSEIFVLAFSAFLGGASFPTGIHLILENKTSGSIGSGLALISAVCGVVSIVLAVTKRGRISGEQIQ